MHTVREYIQIMPQLDKMRSIHRHFAEIRDELEGPDGLASRDIALIYIQDHHNQELPSEQTHYHTTRAEKALIRLQSTKM